MNASLDQSAASQLYRQTIIVSLLVLLATAVYAARQFFPLPERNRIPAFELRRRAVDSRRAGVHRVHGWYIRRIRRHHIGSLWKINVGVGFNAPPMTFEVNGKQYVAILAGLSRIAINKHIFTPELKEQRNQSMLFVFGL